MAIGNSSNQNNTIFLYSAFIILLTNFLSVNGLRCHQCNSHLNEDCVDLRLRTPHAPIDDQFLTECKSDFDALPFCRKTVVYIAVTEEHRIVRSCGWLREKFTIKNNTCFDADNEGFMETICTCNEDGCNTASRRLDMMTPIQTMTAGLIVAISSLFR